MYLCESRSSTYSRYCYVGSLERVQLGPSMGGDERVVKLPKTLGSLRVAQVLRLSIDVVIGFHASVSDYDVDH